MIRAALLCLVVMLGGCAGISTYVVQPFRDDTGQLVCCKAFVQSGKDVASVSVHVAKTGSDSFTIDFSEAGVGATAPITAITSVASGVAGAVTDAAITAAKFAK